MKTLISVMLSLLVSFIAGASIAMVTGFDQLVTTGVLGVVSLLPIYPQGSLAMGVLKEIWTGELIKMFRHDKTFLGEIGSRNEMVNNNVIHMVDVGADPDVLINNVTYPIAISGREDEDVAVSLNKFDTENTKVTKDELYALSYDKIGSVIESHKLVLEDKTADMAAHSLAPTVSSEGTPIISTTGSSNGATYARKSIDPDNIIEAKRRLDDLKVPLQGRILVLCNAHVQELLKIDEIFAKQYKDMATGQILNMYGFKIYQYLNNPLYSVVNAVITKKAFGAAAAPSTDLDSSFFFYAPRAFQARGEVDMFYQDASVDPQYRQSVVGFRLYHICMPKKVTGFGAIVSVTT